MNMLSAPVNAICPMKPDLRWHYLQRQLEDERAGRWESANRLNQWLAGAFVTMQDVMDDKLPLIRRHFLRRLCKACLY